MKKTFFKNLLRDIGKTFSRYISIVIIIAVGVSFYAGVRATSPDMDKSADAYLFKNNFMDFKIISTLGITDDDITAVEKLEGVKRAEGAFSIDAVILRDSHALVLNINSIPANNGINEIQIVNGRMAQNSSEAVVEESFLNENNIKIGDEIELESGKNSSILDDLNNNRFKVVGSACSPLYMSAQRQLSSVGNGSVKGFVYILPEVFKSDVYTEMYLQSDKDEAKDSLLYNDVYKKSMDDIEKGLKAVGIVRSQERYDEVLKKAQDKISDAQAELDKAKNDAEIKIADGYKKIEDAREKLLKGEREYKNNKSDFEKKISDGKKQITEGRKQLEDNQNRLYTEKQKAAQNISAAIKSKVDQLKALLDSEPANQQYAVQYNMLNKLYENDIKDKGFDQMYSALKADGAIEQMKPDIDMDTVKAGFDSAQKQIDAGMEKLNSSEAELDKASKDGNKRLADARKELDDGWKKIDENTKKLKSEQEKAKTKIQDAENKIEDGRNKLNDIKEPKWYVLGRSANVGYEAYRLDSQRIGSLGKSFPFIFFLVAALVSLTTMTRMVLENRTEIGTFKALGYSRSVIVMHYLLYALSASLAGSIIGISFAFKLFPPLIMKAYETLYTVPESVSYFDSKLAFYASMLAVLFTTLAAAAATLEELREAPASLMRPKPPKSGKRILLERVKIIWRKLSFTQKVTARNIFRYKQRLLMTVIGIAACTGLMITGFGLKGGVVGSAENQFSRIYRYDMYASFNKELSQSEKNIVENKIKAINTVDSILFAYSKNCSIKGKELKNQDAYLVVPENKEQFNKYINLTMGNKDLKLTDEGVIITQKLSGLIGKKTGDTFDIDINDKVINVKITGITEHYIQHYVYMSPVYYKKVSGVEPEYNAMYGILNDKSEASEDKITKVTSGIHNISSVSFKNNTHHDYKKSMQSINSVVLILIVAAAVLAFVVIYNLTNINISERKRELATIKLLGFYNNELAAYIYRENIFLTLIGSVAGIAAGIILSRFVLNTAETNIVMFYKTIYPVYFVYSVLLTIAFSVVVNIVMYRAFDKIDMIESLKSAE